MIRGVHRGNSRGELRGALPGGLLYKKEGGARRKFRKEPL